MTQEDKDIVTEDKVTTKELEDVLTEISTETQAEAPKKQRIILHEDNLVTIDKRDYRLVENYRDGFDIEQINERYSDVLNRYDYIVGDIGFEQLRLKGFFSDQHKKMPLDSRIGALQDYLYEYCNFGCAYYVLERIGASNPITETAKGAGRGQQRNRRGNKKNRPGQPNAKQPAHLQEKKGTPAKPKNQVPAKKKPVIKNRRDQAEQPAEKREPLKQKTSGKRNFTIRQTDSEPKGD